ISAGDLAGGRETVRQAKFPAQVESSRLAIEESVRADLDAITVALQRVNLAAKPVGLFEDQDLRIGPALLQPMGQRQPGDSAADNDDPGHDRCLRLSIAPGGRRSRP